MFGTPSPLPALKKGADIRVYAAKLKKAKLEDAQRLRNDKAWAQDVITNFSNTEEASK